MSSGLFEENCVARDRFLESMGVVDDHVISHLINPSMMGGPSWPAVRQAWKVIRKEKSVMIASDGLSDPFEEESEKNSGFEIEFVAETTDIPFGEPSASWLFRLVNAVSQEAAYNGSFKSVIDDLGIFTMELYAEKEGLGGFKNESGMVGVIFGVDHPNVPKKIDLPGGNISIVTVKILTSSELEYVVENGAEGRKKLNELFSKQGSFHLSSLDRKSVV